MKIRPIYKIEMQGLTPYDYGPIYESVFKADIGLGTIPEMNEKDDFFLRCIDYWRERDKNTPSEWRCNVSWDKDKRIYTHMTAKSVRVWKYYRKTDRLVITFPGGSSTFAYQVLAELAPHLEREKWRGICGDAYPVWIDVSMISHDQWMESNRR